MNLRKETKARYLLRKEFTLLILVMTEASQRKSSSPGRKDEKQEVRDRSMVRGDGEGL